MANVIIEQLYYGSPHGRGNYQVLAASPGVPPAVTSLLGQYVDLNTTYVEEKPAPVYSFFRKGKFGIFTCTSFLGKGSRGMEYLVHALVIPLDIFNQIRGNIFLFKNWLIQPTQDNPIPEKPEPGRPLHSIELRETEWKAIQEHAIEDNAKFLSSRWSDAQLAFLLFRLSQGPLLLEVADDKARTNLIRSLMALLPPTDRWREFSFTSRYVLGHKANFQFAPYAPVNRSALLSQPEALPLMTAKEFTHVANDWQQQGNPVCMTLLNFVKHARRADHKPISGYSLLKDIANHLVVHKAISEADAQLQNFNTPLLNNPQIDDLLRIANHPQNRGLHLTGVFVLKQVKSWKDGLVQLGDTSFFAEAKTALANLLEVLSPTERIWAKVCLKNAFAPVDMNLILGSVLAYTSPGLYSPNTPVYRLKDKEALFESPERFVGALNIVITNVKTSERYLPVLRQWMGGEGVEGLAHWQEILPTLKQMAQKKKDAISYLEKLLPLRQVFIPCPLQDPTTHSDWYLKLIDEIYPCFPELFDLDNLADLALGNNLLLQISQDSLARLVPVLVARPGPPKAVYQIFQRRSDIRQRGRRLLKAFVAAAAASLRHHDVPITPAAFRHFLNLMYCIDDYYAEKKPTKKSIMERNVLLFLWVISTRLQAEEADTIVLELAQTGHSILRHVRESLAADYHLFADFAVHRFSMYLNQPKDYAPLLDPSKKLAKNRAKPLVALHWLHTLRQDMQTSMSSREEV